MAKEVKWILLDSGKPASADLRSLREKAADVRVQSAASGEDCGYGISFQSKVHRCSVPK